MPRLPARKEDRNPGAPGILGGLGVLRGAVEEEEGRGISSMGDSPGSSKEGAGTAGLLGGVRGGTTGERGGM